MAKIATFAAFLLLFASLGCKAQDTAPKPVTAAGVLALIGGNALPETTAHAIEVDGIAFRPDDYYRSLLKTAYADDKVIAALTSAKVTADIAPEDKPGKEILQHFANAAALTHDRNYDRAAEEIEAASPAIGRCPECSFVMAYVYQRDRDWPHAEAAFNDVLAASPSFPGVHARMALVYLNEDNAYADRALIESRTALLQFPDDPEAHKNQAMTLAVMRKSPAAIAEYQVALRLKPDYQAAHMNLAVLYRTLSQFDDAIAEYRVAVRLDPKDDDSLYDLGNCLTAKGDLPGAIQIFRQAKAVAPQRYDIRQNLGAALISHNENAEAVVEFRELVQMYPDAEMAVSSLGLALFRAWKLDEAIPVLRKAIALDPTDAANHCSLGGIFDTQHHDDDALKEYQAAEEIDPTNGDARKGLGRVLIRQKNYARAADEMKKASVMMTSDPDIHKLYGEALQGQGDLEGAIAQFRQAAAIDPSRLQIAIELASALEKKGDWPAALDEYHRAASADASIDIRGKVTRSEDRDPQKEYADAKKRYDAHLAELRSSGKSAEAAALEAQMKDAGAKQSVSAKIDTLMMDGFAAMRATRVAEAQADLKQVIDLEQQLTPHDARLVTALDYLGMTYVRQDNDTARGIFERELKAATDLYGADSPSLTPSLTSLGNIATMQKDFAAASTFYFRAVDVNEKKYGETSDRVANALVQAATPYFVQQDYEKAEPYLLRAVRIDQALFTKDDPSTLVPVSALCNLYDRWQKPDKLAACDQELIAILEKEYGQSSPVLVQVLSGESGALRQIGRTQEADTVDQRVAQIRSATMKSP